jgi:hypothetical protein
MAASQSNVNKIANDRPHFEPPVFSEEIFTAPNDKFKLLLNVTNFNGHVRVGISKKYWNEEKKQFCFAAKGHSCFPAAVCDQLLKLLPTAKAEAERLERSIETPINGYTGAPTQQPFIGRGGYGQFGRVVENPRFAGSSAVSNSIFAFVRARGGANGTSRRPYKKRCADEGIYKTEAQGESVDQKAQAKKRFADCNANIEAHE